MPYCSPKRLGVLDSRGHICLGISLTQGELWRLLLMLLRSRGTELVSYQVNWLIVEVNHIIQRVGGVIGRSLFIWSEEDL